MARAGGRPDDETFMVRAVVADDSPFVCRLLTQYLESDPDIRVVQTAHDGAQAIEATRRLKPDVLTLDLNMPVLNGLEALKRIMTERPTPAVLISGVSRAAAERTRQGFALGAVDFVLKYSPGAATPPEAVRREIVAKVKAAARVKVIRSIPPMAGRFPLVNRRPRAETDALRGRPPRQVPHLVAVGASTGGPLALKALLTSLRPGFPFALVIVQHMPEGFISILANQFDRMFPFPVREALDGAPLTEGTVLIAPGGRHLLVAQDGRVNVVGGPEINGQRPSIDVTMQSAAQAFGNYATGVILSGMGRDGVQGMTAIRNNRGATFAQSRTTCVVDSMPAAVIDLGIVQGVGSPYEIGRWISRGLMKNGRYREGVIAA